MTIVINSEKEVKSHEAQVMLVMIKKVMNYAVPHPCFRVSWIYKFGRLLSVLHGLKNNLLISIILIP